MIPALSDLFSTSGVSNLCFPTALIEDSIDTQAYHQPKFSLYQLDGLSSGAQAIDPNALIRHSAALCQNSFYRRDGLRDIVREMSN